LKLSAFSGQLEGSTSTRGSGPLFRNPSISSGATVRAADGSAFPEQSEAFRLIAES
jgi:hypothetical protein